MAEHSSTPTDAIADDSRFVHEAGYAGELARVVEPVIEDLGFRLVRVIVSGRDGGTIQIMADHATRDINIDDCTDITRDLMPVLDAYAGKAREQYSVEVSSPGIDRPLVRPSDVARFEGYEAKLETRELVDGRKRFKGRIDGLVDGEFRLEVTELEGGPQVLGFPLTMVDSAKLILTDELIRDSLTAAKKAEQADGTSKPDGKDTAGDNA